MPAGLNKNKNLIELIPSVAVTNLLSPVTYNDIVIFQQAQLTKPELIAVKSPRNNFQSQLNAVQNKVNLRFDLDGGEGDIRCSSITAPRFQINGVNLRSNSIQPWGMSAGSLTTNNNARIKSLRANSIDVTGQVLTTALFNTNRGLRITTDNGTVLRSYIVRLKA